MMTNLELFIAVANDRLNRLRQEAAMEQALSGGKTADPTSKPSILSTGQGRSLINPEAKSPRVQ